MIHRYTNVRTSEVLEFPDPQPAYAASTAWKVEAVDDAASSGSGDLGREDLDALDGDGLDKLKRDVLDAYALELGVEDPDKLPNKGAVIDAIEAERSES